MPTIVRLAARTWLRPVAALVLLVPGMGEG